MSPCLFLNILLPPGLSEEQVKVWFQNRRSKWKKGEKRNEVKEEVVEHKTMTEFEWERDREIYPIPDLHYITLLPMLLCYHGNVFSSWYLACLVSLSSGATVVRWCQDERGQAHTATRERRTHTFLRDKMWQGSFQSIYMIYDLCVCFMCVSCVYDLNTYVAEKKKLLSDNWDFYCWISS